MKIIANSPMKYVQGEGELQNLSKAAETLGKKGVFCVVDPYILEKYGKQISAGFTQADFPLYMEAFSGVCTNEEIDRLTAEMKKTDADVVVGVGGGRALDTAKAVSYYTGTPVITVPTSAASDAPGSSTSVIYREDGTFDRYLRGVHPPNIVLVDTSVILSAPVRLFVAGMGDALATYYEAVACYKSRAKTNGGGIPSLAALAVGRASRDILFSKGYRAVRDLKAHKLTEAVDNIVETNIFLGCIGLENAGIAAAHAVHNGLSVLDEGQDMLHGEKVAFCTIVQLVLESTPQEEMAAVLEFCKQVGLPTCLADLGITDKSPEKIMAVAKESCIAGSTMAHMPFEVMPDDVFSAIYAADQIGC